MGRRDLLRFGSVGLIALVVVGWMWTNRNRVEIVSVQQWEPGVLLVNVNSCNAEPEATIAELGEGRYEFEARTTVSWGGEDCLDGLTLRVDPGLDRYELIDKVGGATFMVRPISSDGPVEMNGTWRMVEVDNQPVEIDVNTAVVPEVTIRGRLLDGNFGCNEGTAEIVREGDTDTVLPTGTGVNHMDCPVPAGSGEHAPTEQMLLALFESGFEVERTDDRMTWSGAPGRVVFELAGE